MILAISGKKGSGKSTLARRIVAQVEARRGIMAAQRIELAEPLKQFAVRLLGLPEHLVYGDDDAKETLTDYLWENFPVAEAIRGRTGRMKVRELLQSYATEVFRAHESDIFIDRCLEEIGRRQIVFPDMVALVDDMRFLNEAIAFRERGGTLVRLMGGRGGDGHRSETELDRYGRFDLVLDNRGLSADETWAEIQPFLHAEGIIR